MWSVFLLIFHLIHRCLFLNTFISPTKIYPNAPTSEVLINTNMTVGISIVIIIITCIFCWSDIKNRILAALHFTAEQLYRPNLFGKGSRGRYLSLMITWYRSIFQPFFPECRLFCPEWKTTAAHAAVAYIYSVGRITFAVKVFSFALKLAEPPYFSAV